MKVSEVQKTQLEPINFHFMNKRPETIYQIVQNFFFCVSQKNKVILRHRFGTTWRW